MNQEEERNKKIVIDVEKNCIKLYDKKKLTKILNGVRIGKNGTTEKKKEGDMCTPKGTFNLGFAFGTLKNTFTYPYYKINENIYWVSDSTSPFYNEWVEITEKKEHNPFPYMHQQEKRTWNDAEHLIEYPIEYEIAIVIEYNINPQIPGKGSAIFFHIQNKETTSGCVATSKENMLFILNWLDKEKGQITIF